MTDKFHILVLNGPNLNMLGTREPEKYGTLTLSEIVNRLGTEAASLNVDLDHFQSNAEYALIDRIHQAKDNVDYILINPAAFTHTSVAIRDALLAVLGETIALLRAAGVDGRVAFVPLQETQRQRDRGRAINPFLPPDSQPSEARLAGVTALFDETATEGARFA